MKITKEQLIKDPNNTGAFETSILYNEKMIPVSLDPDDLNIEKTILLANKIIEKIEYHEKKAMDRIVNDFLGTYNDVWSDKANGFPILNDAEFRKNLTLVGINFLSNSNIDFFYNENGMFGNHSLIAQSLDGENFEYSEMFG
jgi:hypothetical protein